MILDDEDAVDITVGELMSTAARPAADTGVSYRRGYIGGSDAAAIVGASPWKTAYEVYREKVGESEPADLSGNERVQWGVILEDIVARYYAQQNGVKVRRVPGLLFHRDHPFICAHIDRNILGCRGMLEVKTTGYAWDDIPDHYFPQAQHYLGVTGYDWCDFAVLVAGQSYQQFRCPRDDEYIDALFALEVDFWHNHVVKRSPPQPSSSDDAIKLWPRGAGAVQGTEMAVVAARELYDIKGQIKELDEAKGRIELELKRQIADIGDTLEYRGQKLASWKVEGRSTLDTKAIRAAEPELCKRYMRDTETRVFRLAYKPKGD